MTQDDVPPPDEVAAEAIPLTDALQLLKIDKSTFYRYLRRGWISKFRHGRLTYVPIASIHDYWAKRNAEAAKAQAAAERAFRAAQRKSTRSTHVS